MPEDILTPVNADQVSVEGSQPTESTVNEVQDTSANNLEVADPEPVQQTQDPQTNATYANIRRESEKKAKDEIIAQIFGEQGITTYEQYQQALQEQQARDEAERMGVDPLFYQKTLSTEAENRELKFKVQDIELRQDPIKGEYYSKWESQVKDLATRANVDLTVAFSYILDKNLPDILANQKTMGQQDAIRKLTTNAQTTPGALGNGGETPKASINSMTRNDFNDLVERVKRGEVRNL